MNRFLLVLPLLAVVPVVGAFSAPKVVKPKVAPTAAKQSASVKIPLPAKTLDTRPLILRSLSPDELKLKTTRDVVVPSWVRSLDAEVADKKLLVALEPPAPATPDGGAPPTVPSPVVKPPAIKPPAGMDGHDHEHEDGEENESKDPIGDSLDYLWKQSDAAFHAGDYPTAVRIHRAIVTLDPTDTESFGVGAWLLWSMGQKREARAFIQQGLNANPKEAEMWNVAGQHYDLEKSFKDAKNAYSKAVALSGAKAPELLQRRLAHAAEHAGDLRLSEATWTNLVRDYPESPVNKNNLARVKTLRTKA